MAVGESDQRGQSRLHQGTVSHRQLLCCPQTRAQPDPRLGFSQTNPSSHIPGPCSRRATRTSSASHGPHDASSQKAPFERARERGFLRPVLVQQTCAWLWLLRTASSSPTPASPTPISHQKPQLKGLEAPSGPRAHGPLAPLLRFPKSYAKVRPAQKSVLSNYRRVRSLSAPRRHRIVR